MHWDTRLGILLGLVLAIAALFYFRVFQPTGTEPGIPIQPGEPASEPAEFLPPKPLPPEPSPVVTPDSPSPPKPVEPEPVAPEPELTPIIAPPPEPIIEPEPEVIEPISPQPRIYTVKEGDSLWSIAADQLGDPTRHQEIFKLNRETLKGKPDNLKIGQELILPAK